MRPRSKTYAVARWTMLAAVLTVVACTPAVRRTATKPQPPQLAEWEKAFEDCRGLGAIFPVDLAHAQESLPEGFHARDADGMIQVPAGYAAGVVWTMMCAEAPPVTHLFVLVDPPDPKLPEVPVEIYEVARYVGDPAEAERLRGLGFEAIASYMTADIHPGPPATGNMSLEVNGKTVFEASAQADHDRIDVPKMAQRWWHRVGDQQTYLAVVFPPHHPWIGKPTQTSIAPGSLVDRLVGRSNPTAAEPVIVEILDQADYHARFVIHEASAE